MHGWVTLRGQRKRDFGLITPKIVSSLALKILQHYSSRGSYITTIYLFICFIYFGHLSGIWYFFLF